MFKTEYKGYIITYNEEGGEWVSGEFKEEQLSRVKFAIDNKLLSEKGIKVYVFGYDEYDEPTEGILLIVEPFLRDKYKIKYISNDWGVDNVKEVAVKTSESEKLVAELKTIQDEWGKVATEYSNKCKALITRIKKEFTYAQ